MMNPLEGKIEEAVRNTGEALTYGEVLAKCLNQHPYFPSIATNICCSGVDTHHIDLFFDNAYEKAVKFSNHYVLDVLPAIKGLERKGAIKVVSTNKKKDATHTNFAFDKEQKFLKRLERESARKTYIQPALNSIARCIARKISSECPQEFETYLVGSSSPRSVKPFIHYGNRDVIEAVSDLDLKIFSESLDIESLKPWLDEISRERKIPINIVVKREYSERDRGMIEKALPIAV